MDDKMKVIDLIRDLVNIDPNATVKFILLTEDHKEKQLVNVELDEHNKKVNIFFEMK